MTVSFEDDAPRIGISLFRYCRSGSWIRSARRRPLTLIRFEVRSGPSRGPGGNQGPPAARHAVTARGFPAPAFRLQRTSVFRLRNSLHFSGIQGFRRPVRARLRPPPFSSHAVETQAPGLRRRARCCASSRPPIRWVRDTRRSRSAAECALLGMPDRARPGRGLGDAGEGCGEGPTALATKAKRRRSGAATLAVSSRWSTTNRLSFIDQRSVP